MGAKLRHKKRDLWLGIDPGRFGYVCVYDGRRIVEMIPIPWLGSEPDLHELIGIFVRLRRAGAVAAKLERQQAFGKESARSAFTAGGGYVALKVLLMVCRIQFDDPDPDDWKRAMRIPKVMVNKPTKRDAKKKATKKATQKRARATKEEKRRRKELTCRKAQQLQPGYDFKRTPKCKGPDDNKCEAFLLAVFAHRDSTRSEDGEEEE